ncbi:hypothetical protein LguiB_011158 [Lonicera macranthoides]
MLKNLFIHKLGEYIKEMIKGFEEKMIAKSLEDLQMFGHFKIWHGEGSVLVKVSFSSVFGGCLPCKILSNDSPTLQTVGYSFFAAIFNVGWAATKVDNLSLYAVALMIFSVSTSNSPANVENQVPAIIFICSFIVSVLLQVSFRNSALAKLEIHYHLSPPNTPNPTLPQSTNPPPSMDVDDKVSKETSVKKSKKKKSKYVEPMAEVKPTAVTNGDDMEEEPKTEKKKKRKEKKRKLEEEAEHENS